MGTNMTNKRDENTETTRPAKPTIAEELAGLHATLELQARQIEYLRARVRSLTDDCGIWAEGWPEE